MTNRRNFVKQAAAVMAMAAMPGVIQSASEEREKGLTLKRSQIKVDDQWDVIIVGGGPAGCTAAIAAAREGAKTLLIEAMGQLGGMGTAGMVPAWCPFSDGEKIIYKGLAEKINYNGIPFIILISPEGIILEKELWGDGIREAITKYIK